MELLRLASIVALSLLFVSCLVVCDDDNSKTEAEDDVINLEDKCVNSEAIKELVKDLEEEMDYPAALADVKEKDDGPAPQRTKRSVGYPGYQAFRGFQGFHGYQGYNGFNQYTRPYLGGSRLLPWLGGYNGYGYNNYAYTNSRVQSFIQSFRPANYHVENNCARNAVSETQVFTSHYRHVSDNCVVHNFYKQGTYTTAKTEFLALPFVRVIPVTTVKSIDYVGLINRGYSYTATLCNSCHHGYPQIELRCNVRPYHHVVRRFTFLPETARQEVQYGVPQTFPLSGGMMNGQAGMVNLPGR